MSDSTFNLSLTGRNDAPNIQLDDKAVVTDIYAFIEYGPPAGDDYAPATTESPDPATENTFGLNFFKNLDVKRLDDNYYERLVIEVEVDLGSEDKSPGSGSPPFGSAGDPADTPGAVSDVLIPIAFPPFPAGNATGSDEDGPAMDGFPNGNRFGDDVLDIAVTAAISDLRMPVGLGGSADAGAASGSAPLGDFPYQTDPYAGTTGTHPDPLADNGDVFDHDDPEDLGDGESIL